MLSQTFDPDPMVDLAGQVAGLWNEAALQQALDQAEARRTGEPTDRRSQWVFAIANHNLAVLGKRGYAGVAQSCLAEALKQHPNDALALAYLGNATIMVARDSRNVMTKASTVKKGLDHLDRAVELAPDDTDIRQLRAGSGKRLPKLFGRKAVAQEDLAHLIALVERDERPQPELLAESCFELAMLLSGPQENARRSKLLNQAIAAAPESEWARKAAVELSPGRKS
jgi:tetratricopeptide (TPR) repeat protein